MRRHSSTLHPLVTPWLAPAVALSLASASLPARSAPEPPPDTTAAETPTGSDEDEQMAQQFRVEAEQRFAAQDYEGAIEAFEGAYARAPDPTDLFNIGRINEERGELEQALAYYQRFSREPRLSLRERQVAAERIEVLRVLVEAPSSAPAPESTPAPRPAPPPEAPTEDRPRRAVSPLVTGGAVLLGVGATTALAGGVAFGVSARRVSETIDALDEGRNPDRLSLAQAEDEHARGQNYEALQITFIAAGAAMTAAGAGLLAWGLVRSRRVRLEALAPTLSPRMVALHATWRF